MINQPGRQTIPSYTLLLIPLLFAIVGFSVGNYLAEQYFGGAFVNWRSLGNPPSEIKIIWHTNFEERNITVQTQDNKVFQGSVERCENNHSDCWVEDQALTGSQVAGFLYPTNCETRFSQMRSLPERIVQCASRSIGGERKLDEAHFAVLTDGSVWFWQFNRSNLSLRFLNLGFPLAGIGLGAFIALYLHRKFFTNNNGVFGI